MAIRECGIIALCFTTIFSAGCSSIQTLTPESDLVRLEALAEGDRVLVTRHDGSDVSLVLTESDRSALRGTDPMGNTHEIAWEDIKTIQVRQARPGKTAAAVGGTAAGVYLLIMAITAAGVAAVFSGA